MPSFKGKPQFQDTQQLFSFIVVSTGGRLRLTSKNHSEEAADIEAIQAPLEKNRRFLRLIYTHKNTLFPQVHSPKKFHHVHELIIYDCRVCAIGWS